MPIFKAYDIRGLVPEELSEKDAHRIGRATARHLGGRRLVVGSDARTHSPGLVRELIRGITDEGTDVVDIGWAATPMLYYAVESLEADGGIMVTASHNPKQYNGFKVCGPHARPVGQDTGLRDIEALTHALGDAPGGGSVESVDVRPGYARHVLAVGVGRPELKVAIDCGNGMASVGLEGVLAELPLEVERLYFEPDGTFPNHPADPLEEENLADVSEAVRRTGAAFGVAFDGDGDRAVFVDESGRPVASDLMIGVLARSQLRRYPKSRVLYDLRSSWATPEEIEAAGGEPGICRVGHSFIKAAMHESGASFAGELSGHFYFRFSENLVCDDGTAALIALLDVLADDPRPLSELMEPLRRYFASGEINRRVPDPHALIEEVAKEHASAPETSRLDGLLVRYDDWWFNLRPSNTEPLLRLNLEARSEDRMIEERDRLVARMEAAS
ncbi:MAG: phosphomannomutase/phosphoglucomutase [Myxococcota bacterium]|nr:phosphomannomutase/phosphoglucomutase [Myxococcota bacterium]